MFLQTRPHFFNHSAYGDRPSTVDGRNDMHVSRQSYVVREALSLGNEAAAAAAKGD